MLRTNTLSQLMSKMYTQGFQYGFGGPLWPQVNIEGPLFVESAWFYEGTDLYHLHLPRMVVDVVDYDRCLACRIKVPKEVLDKLNFILEPMNNDQNR